MTQGTGHRAQGTGHRAPERRGRWPVAGGRPRQGSGLRTTGSGTRSSHGFTLIDLIVVLAIIGILAAIAVRPREVGELPIIFAGPVGAVVGHNGMVVAVPAAGAGQ